jgi:hypothetical protein
MFKGFKIPLNIEETVFPEMLANQLIEMLYHYLGMTVVFVTALRQPIYVKFFLFIACLLACLLAC